MACTVAAMQLKTNTKGGLYEQFKLERQGDQTPLDRKPRPTAAEISGSYQREDSY
jgi:hypothetical protein